jgi:hypothetical protein
MSSPRPPFARARTSFSAPRTELGARAVELLSRVLAEGPDFAASIEESRILLPCTIFDGVTLGPVAR